ncbi:MAG: ProQ/FinO family protein [Pseudomonadota bacterium]|nr:ProQ/FinO family protein [Pseudomonadota bacterium]
MTTDAEAVAPAVAGATVPLDACEPAEPAEPATPATAAPSAATAPESSAESGSRATSSAAAPPPAAATDAAPKLKQLFPALFVGAPKPLKLRIQVDIQQRAPGAFTKPALSAFFRRYTGSTSYLQAVAHGKQRFDLDGQPAGDIADEHRKVASDELARRRAAQESRRALEEQQRRNRAGLLHDFERTTLTRANFCALKEVAEGELDGLLAIAREEVAQDRAAEPRVPRPRHERPNDGTRRQAGARNDGRRG